MRWLRGCGVLEIARNPSSFISQAPRIMTAIPEFIKCTWVVTAIKWLWLETTHTCKRKRCSSREIKKQRMFVTLKDREYCVEATASPCASEKAWIKEKLELTATKLWAWPSTISTSSIVFLNTLKSILTLFVSLYFCVSNR